MTKGFFPQHPISHWNAWLAIYCTFLSATPQCFYTVTWVIFTLQLTIDYFHMQFCFLWSRIAKCIRDFSDFSNKDALFQDCPRFSEWSEWSSCTVSCGRGTRRHVRSCLYGVFGNSGCDGGELIERETCNAGVSCCWFEPSVKQLVATKSKTAVGLKIF